MNRVVYGAEHSAKRVLKQRAISGRIVCSSESDSEWFLRYRRAVEGIVGHRVRAGRVGRGQLIAYCVVTVCQRIDGAAAHDPAFRQHAIVVVEGIIAPPGLTIVYPPHVRIPSTAETQFRVKWVRILPGWPPHRVFNRVFRHTTLYEASPFFKRWSPIDLVSDPHHDCTYK